MYPCEIYNHANEFPQEEVCGIVFLNKYHSVEILKTINNSLNKSESFSIDPKTFLKYKLEYNVIGIYHSHPNSTERPSVQDKKESEELGVPYFIYSLQTKKSFIYYPKSYKRDNLLGQPYIRGFNECTCLFKDVYKNNLNLDISTWNKNYWLPEDHDDANKLLMKILNKNMNKVSVSDLKRYDLMVFDINQKRYHVGVYMGGDIFIHQPINSLSCNQMLDDRWQNKIKSVYRHPQFV